MFLPTAYGIPQPGSPPSVPDRARIAFADVPGASQTLILMWGPGLGRTSPDYYAATVMASIFSGGSLTSRLGANLREMMGSAYSVGGGFSYWKRDGLLVVTAPVQTDRTAAAIQVMLAEAAAMRDSDVTDAEMALARDGAIAGLPLRFATAYGTATEFMDLAYYGVPFTFFRDFAADFGAVDKPAVRKAAADYLPADGLRFVVVGDGKAVLPMLRDLTAPSGPLADGGLRVVDGDGKTLVSP
jgi:zinc protease